MIEPEAPIAAPGGYGHNSGAMLETLRAEQAEAMRDTVREGGKTWADRIREFLRSAAVQRVTDRHSAANAGDTIKLAAAVRQAIMDDRFARTEPYYRIHRELSEMANAFVGPLDEAMAGLKAQIDAWQVDEDKRIVDQQREQDAMLANLRSASAGQIKPSSDPNPGRAYLDYTDRTPAVQSGVPAMRPAKKKVIRGDLGSTITQVDATEYEIEDYALIPAHIIQSPVVRDAILSVVKRTAKQLGVPAGIRAIAATTSRVN